MSTRRLFLALVLLTLLPLATGCDSANPVAPSGTVLFLSASPQRIGVNGSSTITVSGFRPDGNPINPGTQVRLATSLGTIEPTLVSADSNGHATAQLLGNGRSGEATVTATLVTSAAPPPAGGDGGGGGGGGAGSVSSTVTVQIGESEETKPTLELNATPSTISIGETSRIRVLARNPDGSRFGAGGVVILSTSLGSIAPTQVTTDANGEATATLSSGNQAGTAVISAVLGASDTATVDVTIENQRPELILFANPSTVPLGGTSEVSIIARDENGFALGAGHRIRLTADLGSVPSEAFTDANGEAEVTFTAGSRSGQGSVTAILGNSEPETVTITIQEGPANVTVAVSDPSISRNGGMTTITATVTNADGQGVSAAVVRFRIIEQGVNATFSPGSQVLTDSSGRAQTTLTVNDAPDNLDEITVEVSASAEETTVTSTITIDLE